MPVRLAITKQTASGEQFVVDVCQWNPVTGDVIHEDISELTRLADECMKLGDMRSLEMHTRMLEAYGLRQHCIPEVWYKIQSVLDILAGNITADTVARRWQSEIEENAELEAGREQAVQTTAACYRCHKQSDVAFFVPTADDPLAQVCESCKNNTYMHTDSDVESERVCPACSKSIPSTDFPVRIADGSLVCHDCSEVYG